MDSYLNPDQDNVRISGSPSRCPQITDGLTSPVRSVHPQMMQQMDSINSEPDFGLRTTDFFDDTSDDESPHAGAPGTVEQDVDLLERRRSATRKPHPASATELFALQGERKRSPRQPGNEGYQRLKPSAAFKGNNRMADTASSSFNGSVDELLPGAHSSIPAPFSQSSRIPSGRTPRSSAQIERSDDRHSAVPTIKANQTLGAFAIAHEITLQALMRDEDALDKSLQSFAPVQSGYRQSLLPPSLDPRSPRTRNFSSPPSTNKKVHVVPPPIDTTAPRRSLPADIIRTPYPFTPDRVHRKDFGYNPPPDTLSTPISNPESVLTLRIRQSNPNSRARVNTLTVPASNDFSIVRSSSVGEKERHFKALDFDDEEFFRQLRLCYNQLSGAMRFLSARSLRRITISGPASKAADAGYGWLYQPRSPRTLAYKGLRDTFSEEKILQHYRKPDLGHARYAFVHWAHRLAAAPPIRTSQGNADMAEAVDADLVRRLEQPEGLEFVVSWSVARIVGALGIVFAISIAAALLWIFLGHTIFAWPSHAGYHGAGDRLLAGVVMGICILLVGLSGLAGWLGVSWLVM